MTPDDRSDEAFRRALNETARAAERRGEGRGAPIAGVRVNAGFDLPPAAGGGAARWSMAMEWEDEPSAQPEPSPPARPAGLPRPFTDLAEAAAGELRFAAGSTEDDLARRWRAFVWLNHPDRQPAHAREQANARVAVANALYDRARRALRGG
jgi:hypothetical protein